MWTPRRIFLLLVGLIFCGAVYYTYALVLGGIDGLPPLPRKYSKVQTDISPANGRSADSPPSEKPSDIRIQQAFGLKCPELNYKIKFESRLKGVLIAAGDMIVRPDGDGRVELTRCSLAMFGKTLTPDAFPEINVIHCDRCFLEFDRPVRKLGDNMDISRIVSAELVSDPELPDFDSRKGLVRVRNNRKTADSSDDLELKTVGPVFYVSEPKPANPGEAMPPNIRTSAAIEVVDGQNLPLPDAKGVQAIVPTITADGMNIWLQQDEPKGAVAVAGKPAAAKKGGSYSGVDRIELLSNVLMNHFSDGGSGFPTPGVQPEKKPATTGTKGAVAVVPDRKQIQIRTPGTFLYYAVEDVAHFKRASAPPAGQPNHVVVTRQGREAGLDSLTSDFLDVHFNRKHKTIALKRSPGATAVAGVGNAAKTSTGQDMDIDRVHAWGENLVLSSDSDALSAWGNDLVYDKSRGETLLTGQPKMLAIKDGNQIEAISLLMTDMDDRTKQRAIAKGPGVIGMGEKDPKTRDHNRQAHWNDTLTFSRVREGGKDLDLLVLKGGAKFVDVVGDQNLRGQQIRLWILREEDAPVKPAVAVKPAAPDAVARVGDAPRPLEPAKVAVAAKPADKQQKPHRLEATGAVTAHSADMEVRKAEYLNVWFRYPAAKVGPPAPKGNLTAKAPRPPAIPPGPDVGTIVLAPVGPPKLPVVPMGNPGLSGILVSDRKPEVDLPGALVPANPMNPTIAAGKPLPEPKPPLNLSGKRIETWVVVTDGKHELEKAHCEEDVIVYQKPTEENPNGVSLTGRELELTHHIDGDLLLVKGSDQQLGSVLFNKVSLIGDDIRIDERHNFAIVKGVGSMRLLSSTDLQGDKLQEPRYVTITWRDQMEFYGSDRRATFDGGVQARQDSFDVLCENMQVTMDREVVFSRFRKVPEAPVPAVSPKPPLAGNTRTTALVTPPVQTKEQKETPKIDSMFCDQVPREGKPRPKVLQPVAITEKIIDKNEKLIKYQLIEAREIEGDNLRETMTGHGPGLVRLFQKGSSDPLGGAAAATTANAKPAKEEMKLTRVEYKERMLADKKARKTIFLGDIEAVHLPADNPDIDIDTNKIPEGGFFLKCSDRLEMYTTAGRNRKNVPVQYQNMLAQGSVTIRGIDFAGTASEITYEEEKETILLKGTRESPAVLQKFEIPGGKPRELIAVRIRYNPRTKDYTLEEAIGIRAQ